MTDESSSAEGFIPAHRALCISPRTYVVPISYGLPDSILDIRARQELACSITRRLSYYRYSPLRIRFTFQPGGDARA